MRLNSGYCVIPAEYLMDNREAGLDIIPWTFERSELYEGAVMAGLYNQFDPTDWVIKKDSDMYKMVDVLDRQVGILGIFSDLPVTVT